MFDRAEKALQARIQGAPAGHTIDGVGQLPVQVIGTEPEAGRAILESASVHDVFAPTESGLELGGERRIGRDWRIAAHDGHYEDPPARLHVGVDLAATGQHHVVQVRGDIDRIIGLTHRSTSFL